MNEFHKFSTEKLLQLCSSVEIKELHESQIDNLLYELDERRNRIKNELRRLGVPAELIGDPERRLDVYNKFRLLKRIDEFMQ